MILFDFPSFLAMLAGVMICIAIGFGWGYCARLKDETKSNEL
jgi:hypothetical protein